MCAAGAVVALAVKNWPGQQLLLVVHERSGAAVWDLRAQVLLAQLPHISSGGGGSSDDDGTESDAERASGKVCAGDGRITAVAWLESNLGHAVGDFLTGHADGSIRVWALPADSSGSSSAADSAPRGAMPAVQQKQQRKHTELLQPQLLLQLSCGQQAGQTGSWADLRSNPSSGRSQQVRGVTCVRCAGRDSSSSWSDCCLLVQQGSEAEGEQRLLLVPLPQLHQEQEVNSCTSTHWQYH